MRGRLVGLVLFAGIAIIAWLGLRRGGESVEGEPSRVGLALEAEGPDDASTNRAKPKTALPESESVQPDQREPLLATSGGSLRGKVISTEGAPVAGALVRWLVLQKEDTELTVAWPQASWGSTPRRALERRAAGDGAFEFSCEEVGATPFGSVVLAQHPEHLPGGVDLGASPASWPGEVVIRLGPGEPIEVRVIDAEGKGVSGATVHHAGVPRQPDPDDPSVVAAHERFLFQEAVTDATGRARLAPFRGEQALWAERGEQVSMPWQGPRPTRVVLRLGESFTIGGTLTLPDWTAWDAEYVGERRILVACQEGNLWRPLARLRGVVAGAWGPLRVPLGDAIQATPKTYSVRLEGIPITPIEERFEPPAAGAHRRIDFVAERGNDTYILVQDPSEQPITNARAVAWWGNAESPSTPQRVEGSSRQDGYIYLGSFPERLVQVLVSAPGYSSYRGSAEASYSFTVTLVRGGRVTGRCRHEGEPVRDFEVVYWLEGKAAMAQSRTFFGRDEGRFTLDDLTPGDWFIHAASPVYPLGRPLSVRVGAETTTEVELELPSAIRGGGRVVAADSGEPLAGARVQPYSTGGVQRSFPWGPPTLTGPDGGFDLEAFVLGTNHLTILAEGYARTEVKASAASAAFLDWGEIRLPRPQNLQISLTGLNELRGLSPLDLRLSTMEDIPFPERHFGADGRIRYEDVPPGDHRVFVTYPDETWTRMHLKLDPHQEWAFELSIAGERRLRIRTLDEREKPVPAYTQIVVAGQEENGMYLARMKYTSEDGVAEFEGVRATALQVWVITLEGQTLTHRNLSFGAEPLLEATIRLGDKPLRVRVLDAKGAPLAGAWAMVRSRDGNRILGGDETDAEGWAELFGIPPGAALLDLTHGIAGRMQGTPFDASIDEQEFVLEAAGSLELRLRDGSEALSGVAVRLETTGGLSLDRARPTDERGAVRFEPLGEGAYVFGCRRADCWPVTLALDLDLEHAVREVSMRRLADLELTLRSADGVPIAGAEIVLHSLEFGTEVADWLRAELVRAPIGLRTDSLGVLRVAGLPRGPYAWSVPADETSGGRVELTPGGSNRIAVQLAAAR